MKSILTRSILVVAVVALLSARADAGVSVSISMFQNDLDPYGSWVDVPSYGTCWRPSEVSSDWQPYTVGEWAYTDYGWTWVSHDRWGGMPYHYGTWVWESGYGWVWIPGTVWAPAWVTWCYGDSYVGWAPIPPSINMSYSGYSGSAIVVSQTNYVFVPTNRFVGVEISSARIPRTRNAEVFQQSRQRTTNFGVSGGFLVNRGPSVQRIEQVAHTRIPHQNVSVARVSPTSILAGGAQKGSRLGVIAPATDRSRQFHAVSKNGGAAAGGARAGGGAKIEQHPAGTEKRTVHEQHATAPLEHKTAPRQHETAQEYKAAPQEHKAVQQHETVQQEHKTPPEHKAVQQHETVQQEHKAAPQEHKALQHHEPPPPPPHHEAAQAPPPREVVRDAPVQHGAASGNAAHSGADAGHSSAGGSHGGPPPGKGKQPPPKKDKEPPPPHGQR